ALAERALAGLELDRRQHHQVGRRHAARVGAAVGVVDAVARLRLVGAAVDGIGDVVAVVVEVGAAVLILVAVAVFGLVGATVDGVGHPVPMVVAAGAAAVVVEAVAVLGLIGAVVAAVGHAVAVAVAADGRGQRAAARRRLGAPAEELAADAGEDAEEL